MSDTTQSEVLAVAKGDQKRLEQLAALAGRSPQSMLKFVLRDGFDAVEEDIRETLAAERDIELHGTISHAEVMRKQIAARRAREQFIERGLTSGAEARRTGKYVSADSVLRKLQRRLGSKRQTADRPPPSKPVNRTSPPSA